LIRDVIGVDPRVVENVFVEEEIVEAMGADRHRGEISVVLAGIDDLFVMFVFEVTPRLVGVAEDTLVLGEVLAGPSGESTRRVVVAEALCDDSIEVGVPATADGTEIRFHVRILVLEVLRQCIDGLLAVAASPSVEDDECLSRTATAALALVATPITTVTATLISVTTASVTTATARTARESGHSTDACRRCAFQIGSPCISCIGICHR